jgi:hypothetical protein
LYSILIVCTRRHICYYLNVCFIESLIDESHSI